MMRVLIIAEGRFAAEAVKRSLHNVPACSVIGYVDGRTACEAVLAKTPAEPVRQQEAAEQEVA